MGQLHHDSLVIRGKIPRVTEEEPVSGLADEEEGVVQRGRQPGRKRSKVAPPPSVEEEAAAAGVVQWDRQPGRRRSKVAPPPSVEEEEAAAAGVA
jgi:hypothetical protein